MTRSHLVDPGPELPAPARALVASVQGQRGQGGGHVGRGRSGREDEQAGPVDQQVHVPAGSGDVATEASEHLGQGAHAQVRDTRRDGGRPEHGMGVVEHEQSPGPGTDGGQLVNRRDVAVHGEHHVADHRRTAGGAFDELRRVATSAC